MAKSKEKLQAHKMRRLGMSINDIAKKLCVSKGSISLWCRDIVLTKTQRSVLHDNMINSGHKGRMLGAAANRQKRENNISIANEHAEKIIQNISERDLLLLGLGLYWGEGSKNTENRFTLVNSDPLIIKTIIRWLQEIMHVPQESLSPQI